MQLTSDYEKMKQLFQKELRLDKNFDLVYREIHLIHSSCSLYFVDGFVKDDIMEKIIEFLFSLSDKLFREIKDLNELKNYIIPYVEVSYSSDKKMIFTEILSGAIGLLIEGYTGCILIDAREYPVRSMSEPEDDRVLRGSRDGFVETLIFNTALIRRRIRDEHLCVESVKKGNISNSDIALVYLENKVDKEALQQVKDKLEKIDVEALTMAQESLSETLVQHKWYNPFPKVRYSERPDVAASTILEGNFVLMIDNSSSALLMPTVFFDFIQEAQDFYLPPVTGTYLRMIRLIVFMSTLFITPLWYLIIKNPSFVPESMHFLFLQDNIHVPIIIQFLILEIGIDAIKLASLNTPSALNGSFSIIGALILGDFAVQTGWFNPEVIVYMSYVALANFTQTSYELGYAVKFSRIILLINIALLNIWGFILGLVILGYMLYENKTITGISYLYPLIPWNTKKMKRVFSRKKLK